jgi:hypothetical protein
MTFSTSNEPKRPQSKRALPLALSALLAVGAVSTSAIAAPHGGGGGGHGGGGGRGGYRGNGGWGGGYYPDGPLIYGSPYYCTPPLIWTYQTPGYC